MKICVLPIGYADIIPRDTSLKLYVYINRTKRKVLGTISMDQIIVESREEDKVNDEAYIFGNGSDCPQTIYDLAALAKTIPLEILCHSGYRINRIYVNR
jgi:alanine racemase